MLRSVYHGKQLGRHQHGEELQKIAEDYIEQLRAEHPDLERGEYEHQAVLFTSLWLFCVLIKRGVAYTFSFVSYHFRLR